MSNKRKEESVSKNEMNDAKKSKSGITPKVRKAKKENAVYEAEQRAILILDILKKYTDENHFLSQADLLKIMFDENNVYASDPKVASASSRNTLHKTIVRMLEQMNPVMYDDNDDEYRIKYEGYDQLEEPKSIKKLRYVHDFNDTELDQLMHAVNFDRSMSIEDKQNLMKKLQATASKYYKSPFYSTESGTVKFDNYGIYTRVDAKQIQGERNGENAIKRNAKGAYPEGYTELTQSIKIIQSAINSRKKIQFMLNGYNKNHELVEYPIRTSNGKHTVSPYYIVVYQEFYYLIGAFDNPKKPNFYRIDLMTDVEFALDETDNTVDALPVTKVPGLPSPEKWNPELFMREHLYMFFDEPRNVTLKIKNDNYSFLHDWFGDTYTTSRKPSGEAGYDLVNVRCTTNSIVHFALQWSDRVQVMDEDIRELIRKKIEVLEEKYRK